MQHKTKRKKKNHENLCKQNSQIKLQTCFSLTCNAQEHQPYPFHIVLQEKSTISISLASRKSPIKNMQIVLK